MTTKHCAADGKTNWLKEKIINWLDQVVFEIDCRFDWNCHLALLLLVEVIIVLLAVVR